MIPSRSKYGNRKTVIDGITFASAKEARRYADLKLLERAGEIASLRLQPRFRLIVNNLLVCTYIADFAYRERGKPGDTIEDVKGVKTPEFRLKAKLLKALHDIDVVLT